MSISPICLVNNTSTINGVDVTGGTTVTIKLFDTTGVANWSISCLNTDDSSATSVTALSNGVNLPTGTINVVSTAGFNASGVFSIVGGSNITYTGKTSTSFTGCTGGTGTLATGQRISSVVLTVNQIAKTATFVAPILGNALIFQSVVNFGIDLQGAAQPSYTTTFGVYVLTINNLRVGAAGEILEGDSVFGWTSKFNNLIRSYTGSTSAAGLGMYFASGTYNIGQNADATILVNANDIQLNPAAYSTTATNNTLVKRTNTAGIAATNVSCSSISDTGAAVIGTTLAVGTTLTVLGASTLAALAATTGTFSSTLGVTGVSTLGVLGAGASTLASLGVTAGATVGTSLTVGTTLGVTGAATVGSTLGVTGAATFSSTLSAATSITSPSHLFTSAITAISRTSEFTPQAAPTDWIAGVNGTWTNSALATNVICNIDPPNGCTLTGVTVRYLGAAAHGALPAVMPSVAVKYYDIVSNLTLTLGTQADTSASTGAFQIAHSIALTGLTHTVAKVAARYMVIITAESGANALVGASLISVQYTFTRPAASSVGQD